MAAMRIMITALLLPTPSTGITTTCEIPSVEAGSNATLTTYFGEDMRNAKAKDYTVMHQRQNSSELEMLSCHFTNGDVECDKTPCCTWERHVTDVFRVYIHNVSQEHEGKFWGLVSPAEGDDQTFCRFALKGDTCSIDFINATNNYVNCSSMPVTIGHTCDVSCSNGFFIDGSQTSITYKCIGKNKWSPESRDLSCNEKIETANMLWLLFLLILIILSLGYFIIIRLRRKRKRMEDADTEDENNLLPTEERVMGYINQDLMCHPNLKLRKVSYTDMRDDRNLQRLLNDLLAIADNGQQQNMKLVLSQLQVDNSFGHSTYTAAAAPPPQTKSLNKEHCIKGEFNILILHSHCQLFILQVSSVEKECIQDETTEDDVLIKEVYKMTKELTMAEEGLTNLKSGAKNNIIKCLVMPNIKSNQLMRALDGNPAAKQALCLCLGVMEVSDAVKRTLMSDQFSDEKTSSDVNQTIKEWWQYIIMATSSPLKTEILPSEEDRLFAPDSTIRLHDFEERTKTNEERMVELTLTQDLVKILRHKHKYAFICGPPGTGKSVLLALMALQRLENGDKVYIISTVFENIASSLALKYMLTQNNSKNKHNVEYIHCNLENNDEIIDIIKRSAERNSVFAIIDEIWAVNINQISGYYHGTELFNIENVSIWVTCKVHEIIDTKFHIISLTVPLRYPGKVLEKVKKSAALYTKKKMHMYTPNMPLQNLCVGPDVIKIHHRKHLKRKWPTDCEKCGMEVATVLKGLGIGEVAGNLNTPDGNETESTPPLTYSDVFVLTQKTDLQAHDRFVTGLQEYGINKVRVLKNNCSRDEIKEVVLARNNEVTVAYYLTVLGLQRKVVVFLPHRNKDDNYPDKEIKAYGRCLGMSRCTSQLIVVRTALS